MKGLLFIIACVSCGQAFSQRSADILRLQQPIKIKRLVPADSIKLWLQEDDSSKTYKFPGHQNGIPNAIVTPLPQPVRIGNNGRGHDLYVLPLDKMPLLKPDSSFSSNMPVMRGRRS